MNLMLIIDAGNSSSKWMLFDMSAQDRQQMSRGTCYYDEWDDDASMFDATWSQLDKPVHVLVSNVAGEEFAGNLSAWVSEHWDLQPDFVMAEQAAYGVSNAYVKPQQLGCDRWMALIAARHEYNNAVCIIDCGTAITVDVMDAQGRHLGGMLLPGLDMMQNWLLEDTHIKLDTDDPTENKDNSLFATDTLSGIQSGTVYAVIAFVDRVAEDVISAMGKDIDIILGGGDAARLLPLLSTDCMHDPDLVLKGLMVIAESKS
jgi:type III pantothenate kinase